MDWEVLSHSDYVTSGWSGGTTTQLAIAPAGAAYADRDFLWRLSSARVELEHSDFTPLPDYNRLLSVLSGNLAVRIGDRDKVTLERFSLCAFDGGIPVESWGRCVDFNLMLRKGFCSGAVQHVTLVPGASFEWNAPVAAPCAFCRRDIAIYCVSGGATADGIKAAAGSLLLRRVAPASPVALSCARAAELMISVVYY